MLNPEEEFIMDIKTEEKRTQLVVLNVDSDCSTISASEVDMDECNPPTPPLFCKLKKARVLIKKLPRDILSKYNIVSKKQSSSLSLQPSRSSGRIKNKQIPAGQYLSLHVNKPLKEILNKKKRLRLVNKIKAVAKESVVKKSNLSQNKKFQFNYQPIRSIKTSSNLRSKSSNDGKGTTTRKSSSEGIFLPASRNPHYNIEATSLANISNTKDLNSVTQRSLTNRRNLQERIAATRLKNKPVITTLPNLPDVVITKYDIQPNPVSNSINPVILNKPVNIAHHVAPVAPTTMYNKYKPSSILVSTPLQNKNMQVPSESGNKNFPQRLCTTLSQAFPTSITPAQIPHQSMVIDRATSTSIHQPGNSIPRTFTIRTFKIPQDLSGANSAVIVKSPKVVLFNQSSSGSDPLNMSSFNSTNQKSLGTQQTRKENNADCEFVTCVESESDLELSDTEKQEEPEVIKRIIYHTKSVQTKFTCNSSICGLVDSGEFNLNCFYCYDIFPLHKWLEFKQHIKLVHHVEERENLSDTDAAIDNSNSEEYNQVNSHQTETVNSASESINNTVFNKLPLDPRLITQRINTESENILSSTLQTTPQPSKQLKESRTPAKSSNVNFNKNFIDEIINLDSDDNDLDIQNMDSICKTQLETNKKTANNQSHLNSGASRINDVKLVLPTLPHITVKKVNTMLHKESRNVSKQSSETVSPKPPSKLNIQKVIKAIPKPTSEQSSSNGCIRPRYFVVKKIIKLPTTDTVPNLNVSKGMTLTKIPKPDKGDAKFTDYDDKSSIDKNEVSAPKATNGLGILFGVTNSMIVIEFLLKLKSFPELWSSQWNNDASANCNESIKKLCFHLNSRFDFNITELEMRQSIQRVKDWYSRVLKNIYEHSKNPNTTEPYKPNFPIYFKILQKNFTSDSQGENTFSHTSQFKSSTNMDNEMEKSRKSLDKKVPETDKVKSKPPITNFEMPQAITTSSTIPLIAKTTAENTQNAEMSADGLIEFDADTLYDNESSDEEVLEEFDETKLTNKKTSRIDGQKKKRTKVYVGCYECDICRKTYKRICDLKRHKVLHFPPEFECGLCSQKFYFKHWAERCSHIRNKKYKRVDKDNSTDTPKPKKIWPKKIFRFKMICEICGASYRSIGSLNTHKRDKHLNQRHKCVVCNFTALSNWRIVQHQKKRHIVELGTVEEIAKKSRARTDTKTPFSNEARQEFFWRQEMRKKLKPGEIFYGCCKCRIVFNSRKEKVLHNKIEHPITEHTVICLLCLPNKLLLSNSNCARRHYTDIHKVAWHEIDGLVKRTKPIFNLLSKEEIELLKASANYKELIEELLKDKNLERVQNVQTLVDETSKAVQNLPTPPNIKQLDEEANKIDIESTHEENVYIDGIIDHDYNGVEIFNEHGYTNSNEHNYSEEKETLEHFYDYGEIVNNPAKSELASHLTCTDEIVQLAYDIESNDNKINNFDQEECTQSTVDDFIEGELVEETLVVEEYIDEVNSEEEYF